MSMSETENLNNDGMYSSGEGVNLEVVYDVPLHISAVLGRQP
jgi:hypothetical protein